MAYSLDEYSKDRLAGAVVPKKNVVTGQLELHYVKYNPVTGAKESFIQTVDMQELSEKLVKRTEEQNSLTALKSDLELL